MSAIAATMRESTPAHLPDTRTIPQSSPPVGILSPRFFSRGLLPALAILCGASLIWWCTPVAAFGQAVLRPDAVAGMQAGVEGVGRLVEEMDSLHVCTLEIEMEKARVRAGETSFWHRILPKIQCTARLGLQELFFYDGTPALQLPRDAYGITVSLSLTGVLEGAPHREAELDLQKLQAEHRRVLLAMELKGRYMAEKRVLLGKRLPLLEAELAVTEDIQKFDSLRFQQGKIGYEVFRRSVLALLAVKHQIQGLQELFMEMEYRETGDGR